MTEKASDKEYDNIIPPLTKGEQYQLEKLKRFSEDPKEIKKVRRKLQDAGYGDENAETSGSSSVNKQKDTTGDVQADAEGKNEPESKVSDKHSTSKKQKGKLGSSDAYQTAVPQRRREDRPAFPNFTTSFFKSLLAMFSNSSGFTQKYGRARFVKISLINLFVHSCGFFLGQEVQNFIHQTIYKWQETFKPIFAKLYKTGWRDNMGKPILSPLEFNLIQVASRLASEKGVLDTQTRLRDTRYILVRVNPFIYCYYQLVNAGLQKLLIAFKKSLRSLSHEETKSPIYDQYDDYKLRLIEFFDGRVEENFIIPLLEAITGNILEPEAIRIEAFVEPIDEEDYRADGQLKIRMAVKAKQYEKEFKKKMNVLKKELAFLETVKQDLNHIYFTIEDKNYSAITLALAVTLKENSPLQTNNKSAPGNKPKAEDKPASAGTHIIKDIYYTLNFFLDFYTSLLTERVPVYGERGVEYIEIFNKNVFNENCKELALLHKNLINYFKLDFAHVTTEEPEKDYRKTRCLQLVEKICGQIYIIGKKLYKATSASIQAKPSFKGLDILNLGKFKIPFEDRKLFSHVSRSQGPLVVSLHNKPIKEVMEDIRIFCFDFLRHFEPPVPAAHSVFLRSVVGAMDNGSKSNFSSVKNNPQASDGKTDANGEENLFLDTLVLPEDDNTLPEMHISINGSAPDLHQSQAQKMPVRKTLLVRLENYNEIKKSIEKLKNGEEIADVPEEF